ncbi:kinesin-like protein KIN-14Q isoform X1 [Cucurbita pepo subsp. pepo]|uniref:kinesin-like protein KIN-14Q isoform X1 n=1 Tax=Cucurbita pepo subsp. pepo TaxID=3664 RepID=UPI000C9DA055|nr:kinesin-like protein KIN-14Q isoform X1 [Cucurbita pepo subsp. pepo]
MHDQDSCSIPGEVAGKSMPEFTSASLDLGISAGSPDIPVNNYCDSPEILDIKCCKLMESPVELSFENSFTGVEVSHNQITPSVRFSNLCETYEQELSPESSFELAPSPATSSLKSEELLQAISVNAGAPSDAVDMDGINYVEDNWYKGGDTIRSDEIEHPLYQTARFGDFCYNFSSLEPGNYVVDLHFAEIVFTNGPPGMRVFDVYLQDQNVVSGLDIYARVGGNKPLIISDLKTSVDVKDLSIRFEGQMGRPIVCGISVRKDLPSNRKEVELLEDMGSSQLSNGEMSKDSDDLIVKEKYLVLQKDLELMKNELAAARKNMEELRKENNQKSRECQEAWKSLNELQNELMRKSMHVGSLAFAIEGQVKEKGKWFSSLRDLTRKVKIMKIENIKLSEEALAFKNCFVDMNEMTSKIQTAFKQQLDLQETLKTKFVEGAKERKELYNKMLELKGNIRVFCRCRPLNTEEIGSGASMVVDFESAKDGELIVKSNGAPRRIFKFDSVFGPQANQGDVFEDTAPFAASVLDGYNVCIFAYGQTGTGKTFTMEGTEGARGVNYRILEELFRLTKERQKLHRYKVSVSVLEVYNEQIRDLLVSASQSGNGSKRLEVRQISEGIHHVPGMVEAPVDNMSEVWEVLQTGSNARAVGSTNCNEHSSRSHCIHCVMVKGENLLNGECTSSKLWLVDLAGSERIAKVEVQGERLKETQNINRSLSALGDVISALATKSPHVPFRNSKLTHLLQDSLGGDSKTLMFVQISPNENDLNETLCSLNFASRVRGIELGPAKRQLDMSEFHKCKQMAEKTKLDMKSKDLQIRKMEETMHGLDLKMKEKDQKNKNLQDKVKELEAQLLVERKLARQHVDAIVTEQIQQQQQHMKTESEDHKSAPARPQLAASRPLGSQKILHGSSYNSILGKKQINLTRPLTENNGSKPSFPFPSVDSAIKYPDSTEKENNPEMAEQSLVPTRRTGRASICPMAARRVPMALAPRRISLTPLPSIPSSTHLPSPMLPLPPSYQVEKIEKGDGSEDSNLAEQAAAQCESPKERKYGGKKLSNMLRRSLQKKKVQQMKSPVQQQVRRGGINLGLEKVRVSIGSRGRMAAAHRVLLLGGGGNGRRGVAKETQSKKEKERGWNIGTAVGRTVI